MSDFSRIIFRQGPQIEREKVILQIGEPAYVTDYKRIVVGDGVTKGGNSVGSKFLGFVEFDEFSLEVLNVDPGINGDFVYEQNTNLLYVLSGNETVLGKSAYQIKTNYKPINKTPNPDNINIYNNSGSLSLVPESIDASLLAGYSIGRGLEKNPANNLILQVSKPSDELNFNSQGGLQLSDGGINDIKLANMPANSVKARLNNSGPPTNILLDQFAEVIKDLLISGTTGTIGVPVGTIIDFAGITPPQSYLPCDGRELKREEFFDLFSAIGTTWGAPTTASFNLPDLNNRTTVGSGNNKKGQSTTELFEVGGYFGTSKYTLTKGQLPPHAHSFTFTIPAHTHTYSFTLQEFNGESYTTNLVAQGYNNYITIIGNGPSFAPVTWPEGPKDDFTISRLKASEDIKRHKLGLQKRVVEFVLDNFPVALSGSNQTISSLLSTKCFRDSGYIIDSIAADIANNANHRSIETGTLYFSGYLTANRTQSNIGSSVPSLPKEQVIPTIEAIKAIGSYITGINQPITPHTITAGVLSALDDGYGDSVQDSVLNSYNNFITIINDNSTIPKTKPNGVIFDDAYLSAADVIEFNRISLQNSVVSFVKANYPEAFAAPTIEEENALSAKCFRDTGFIVDSIVADIKNNANHRCVETSVFYFSGALLARNTNTPTDVPTLPSNQVIPTITAIRQLSSFIFNLNNFPVNNFVNDKVIELVKTTTYSLENDGQSLAYEPPGLITGEKIAAANLIRANKVNLQNFITQYVIQKNYLLSNSPELAKCRRDAGFMVDAIIHDLETGTTAKSVQYAVAYWDGSTSRLPENLIPNQKINTIDTINYLRSRTLSLLGNRNSILNQVTDLIETMIYPLENFGQNLPYRPFQTPINENLFAANVLQQNRLDLQNKTIQFVRTINIINDRPDLQDKCYRDIGYMIDSVVSDLRSGVISKTIQFALAYFDGSINRIKGVNEPILGNNNPDQVQATLRTVRYLRDQSLEVLLQNGIKTFSRQTSGTTTEDGAFSFLGNTNDGEQSIHGLQSDPINNYQPSAVVNKIIKVR
jgi:microcystin-dependent protein